ncbi:MAG: heparinase II/III family protein [Deltaproteobacteria bacterium]|nr:heparinase II/III family protein [Deltaproteobacteria bacterium]
MRTAWALVGALALSLLTACSDPPELVIPPDGPRPRLVVTADRKDDLTERIGREPYASILAAIEVEAAKAFEEPDPDVWDHKTIGDNNEIAQANAFLAWLLDDETAASKARDILLRMPTDFETNATWDVNIRMPHVLMSFCFAWDLLRGTPWLNDQDAARAADLVTTVNAKFFDQFLNNPATRQLVLGFSQNNHPIRTASAIGMVAITFPDHPEASTWANWAVSELTYLLGPDGRYLQSDGGVSEGPFYYGFAYGPALAFFIAMDNAVDPARSFARDCRNRQDDDPWLVTDCVEGEPFTFDNPLYGELFQSTVDWSINLRLPSGWRAPLGDANFIALNGGAVLTGFGGAPHTLWDWENTLEESPPMTWGMDLRAHHLAYVDDSVTAAEPPWKNRFMPAAGNAVFRSGWDPEARWLLLVAENGPARKTLHDHVDGTSFTLAAYGEYLLLDPGYYKPDDMDNAVTAHGDSHNLILIDGQGPPDKGLLIDFGDADAFLENTLDGEALAYAEAHESYRDSTIERSVVFVRDRYFVVADRLSTTHGTARTHAWRLGGWAGLDVEGVFEPRDCLGDSGCGARWERSVAGVDVHLAATDPGLQIVEPPHTPLQAPHVEAFDRQRNVVDHGVIDGVVDGLAPGYLAVLAPYRVGAATGDEDDVPIVTPLDAGADAAAWLIETPAGTEVAWLRKPGAATTLTLAGGAELTSDAELTVLDITSGQFGLIARGTSAAIDGSPVVTAGADEPVALVE